MKFCRVTKHVLKKPSEVEMSLYLNSCVTKCALDLQEEHFLAKLMLIYGCAEVIVKCLVALYCRAAE